MLPAGDKIVRTNNEKKFVRWDLHKNKSVIYDMMRQIGDRVTIVFPSGSRIKKHGVSNSVNDYSKKTGKVIEIVYYSAHLVEVEFKAVV